MGQGLVLRRRLKAGDHDAVVVAAANGGNTDEEDFGEDIEATYYRR